MGGAGAAPGAKVFGTVTLGLFTFSLIANINGVPAMAEYGLASLTFYAIAVVFLLIPTALVSAELGSTWPRTGGIYVWVKEAFGERWGFFVIWLEWANFVIAFPSLMTIIAVQVAYVFDPTLASNRWFVIGVVLVATWAATFLALRGLKVARNLTSVAVLVGTLLPAMILIGMAFAWLATGHTSQISFSARQVVPNFGNLSTVVFAATAFLMFSGVEISAVHGGDVRSPQRTIPRANLLASVLCVLLFIPTTIAIAIVVPEKRLDVVAGLMQACEDFFDAFDIGWLVPVFAVLLVGGLLAAMVQILGGPARGLLLAGRAGNLPPILQRVNARGMPVGIIGLQAVASTVLSLVFVALPSVQAAWWALLVTQTQLVLIIYVTMYLAALRLRRTRADVVRGYRVPGGRLGLPMVCGVGLIGCLTVIAVGFVPPEQIKGTPWVAYVGLMVCGMAAVCAVPFVISRFRRPSWVASADG